MAAAIVFLLDESGSMDDDRDAAIRGLNRWITAIAEKFPRVPITISFFNDHMRNFVEDMPAAKIQHVGLRDYSPMGGTALLDAIGSTIHRVENDAMPLDGALLYVYTDGGENSSNHYDFNTVQNKIKELRNMGWVFEFMSSAPSGQSFARKLGIERVRDVETGSQGYGKMYDQMTAGVVDWLDGKE